MARTRQTRAANTVTVNAIDKIVEKLNTLDGIEFAKDAWVNEAPANYGVVRLSNEARQLWADGHLTDSAWNVIVTAYVQDDSSEWPGRICFQAVPAPQPSRSEGENSKEPFCTNSA